MNHDFRFAMRYNNVLCLDVRRNIRKNRINSIFGGGGGGGPCCCCVVAVYALTEVKRV